MRKVLWLAALLTACTPIWVSTPQTFDERQAAGLATVSAVRTSTTTLLREDRISAEDAQRVRAQADNAREGIEAAKALHATDPSAGDARLAAVNLDLRSLQRYLDSRRPVTCPLVDC